MEPVPDSSRTTGRARGRGRCATAAAGVAAIAAATVLAAGCGGSSSSGATTGAAETSSPSTTTAATAAPPPPLAASADRVRSGLRGIPQAGLALGRRTAPVTIVEYGRFSCPQCTAVHVTVVPALIDRYVRSGKASLEFRPVEPDGASAARELALGSFSASVQRSGWDFVQLAYRRSLEGAASGAGVETPARLARALGLDVPRFRLDAARPAWRVQLTAARAVAAVGRFTTYPVFLVRARSAATAPYVVVVAPSTVDELASAIANASRAGG